VRKHGDEPRSKFATSKACTACPEQLERGECSGLPATLWNNLSTETAHVSCGLYSTGQNRRRKPVVRGLPVERIPLSWKLTLESPLHEVADRAHGVFSLIQDLAHLLDDGHFNPQPLG